MQKNSRILALFAIVCTAIVGIVNETTKDRIEAQKQQHLLKTLHSIIAPERLNNDMYQDCLTITDAELGTLAPQTVYLARYNEQPVAAAITTIAPDGYNGNIELIVALNIDNTISGVRILNHQETPGLGDKIEERKSKWIFTFNDKKIPQEKDEQWKVAKDGGMFDQFTGATITPRAVVKAVKKAARYFSKHQQELFSQAANCRGER
ncbi:MAG: electron transport complex subunit RsxG [Gammaproteobacteria bacterium]|nr:MAG: electron transport complex subunit RsxG [Gammaproteobacteria bacterium]